MQTYKVSYYTLSKGREYSNAPGNIRQERIEQLQAALQKAAETED